MVCCYCSIATQNCINESCESGYQYLLLVNIVCSAMLSTVDVYKTCLWLTMQVKTCCLNLNWCMILKASLSESPETFTITYRLSKHSVSIMHGSSVGQMRAPNLPLTVLLMFILCSHFPVEKWTFNTIK